MSTVLLSQSFYQQIVEAPVPLDLRAVRALDDPEKEVEQVKDLVRHEMETVIKLKVPVVVDSGAASNWRDMK